MKTLMTAIVVLVVGLGAMFIFEYGVEKSEKAECLKFQDQALIYPGFFLTEYQKQQCDRYGIEIDTSVEKLNRM
mgnify:CR=1 FL=1